jgi:predicted NodU family carbamoyl transferase
MRVGGVVFDSLRRRTCMGINHSNDAAVCIVRDGEILGGAQEERFTRIKHDANFSARAVEFCLKRAGAGELNEARPSALR